MTPNKQPIKKFFKADNYKIPVYQRAYSWDKPQWSVFLEDLQEATKGSNHYFFGNVLLEKDTNDINNIIDGQQRITTIIIFVRALCNVLAERKTENLNEIFKDLQKETSDEIIDNAVFIKRIEEDYLINRGKAKLQVVEYDGFYFQGLIIKNEAQSKPETPSQERIKKAKEFFESALKGEDKDIKINNIKEILEIFNAMQKAEVLSILFENKKDSVLMFELQNNRGKDLTNMEKLKSYLAYQIYTYCGDKAESKLNEISKIFEEIYRNINDIKLDEDSLLNYFNISKSTFGFNYRENDNNLNYKRELKEIKNEKDKIAWIEDYVSELNKAFIDFKEFNAFDNIYKRYLQDLQVWEIYPFVLKAYRLFRNDENKAEKLEKVFKALEIIAFRDKLVQTRADLASRLNSVLKNFSSVDDLVNGLKQIYIVEYWYWGNDAISDKLNNIYIENKGIVPYLLMRYEKALRDKETESSGYKFELKDIKNPQIEHIAPQTETIEKSGKRQANGYCRYDKDFVDNCYMDCIGNLLLIAGSHNASIGNEPFDKKLESYKSLSQQREIKTFIGKSGIWDKEAINKRHEKLENFVLKTWSFE